MAETSASLLISSRYLSAASFICVLWDHMLTFDQEIESIWKYRRRDTMYNILVPKVSIAVYRYAMEGVLIYGAYVLSGTAKHIDCRAYTWITVASGIAFAVIMQYMLILRIYTSWDQRRVVKYFLAVVFATATSLLLAFLLVTVLQAQGTIRLGFHCIVLAFVIYNALETPRRSHIEVLHELQKDGFKYFFVMANGVGLALSINGNFRYSAIVALSTIVNSRIHIRMEGLRTYKAPGILEGMSD
ncbi:hypothetical protein BDQ17DRAFT_1368452 [Cyathus striatus]|nr:hypothetical protein BDQ17DRAFT_1368452 [Cyathus striatus]